LIFSAACNIVKTWAMLIKRVYEIDPLACPRCGGQMKVVAFIEPPQREVIEKILRGHQSAAIRRGLVTHLVTAMGLAAEMKRLAEQAM
jgi:hypothetical protein